MPELSDEQIRIIVEYRDSGRRQHAAAKAAGVSRWVVSKWCTEQGTPWPRTAARRARHQSEHDKQRARDSLERSQKHLVKMYEKMARSSDPVRRRHATEALQQLRDQPVTNRPVTSKISPSSGYPIRKSGGDQ